MARPAAANTTIAAQATPVGRGGIGVIRLSGPLALTIARQLLGELPDLVVTPRLARFSRFLDEDGSTLDEGLLLYFPAPHSFTGEDVVELQGHGGPMVMARLLRRVVTLGAQLARPGEFSERAFLNDKLDLAQAEAIADLIDASSEQAARLAIRSLQGAFSEQIHVLSDQMIDLRLFVEAAIDFPEEEVDFISEGRVQASLQNLVTQLDRVIAQANRGVLLKEGMRVALAGRPNAGKSSLLNALAGTQRAIVTSIAGTTRDVLQEQIDIDGMPLHIIDTAGLRESPDEIEQEGIRRAWQEIEQADRILVLVDASEASQHNLSDLWPDFMHRLGDTSRITLVRNKVDLTQEKPGLQEGDLPLIRLSAKSGDGVDVLREHLKACMGFQTTSEGGFIARQRHLDALHRARRVLVEGLTQLNRIGAGELLAEDLRLAHQYLGEITGEFSPDELLGRIFSTFCIGK